ncbi:hypothetical protein C8Q76DRAFT_704535 [Earliella scabrosa]|nr:hypothetical protein C8Q76DRAFT_704535 [Earliella scabrosa]
MLKLVDKDSDQYRIFEELQSELAIFHDSSTFPCVLPPTKILDTPHHYAIVAMPMWGQTIEFTDLCNVGEVLRCMTCLLNGLSYLHSRRIAHRDICEYNVVTNCYRLDQDWEQLQKDLRDHWTKDDVVWALMDYDQSIKHPTNVSLKHYRRPTDEAWAGADIYRPDDVYLGEPTYNPFAFDVAMLGNLFRVQFSDAVSNVPALAAMFDRMTTHVYASRFTADEAYTFLQEETTSLTAEVLATAVELEPRWEALADTNIYWSRLGPHIQCTWRHFRTPPASRRGKLFSWIMGFPTCYKSIAFVRRLLQL